MSRRFFRKYLPSRQKLDEDRLLRRFKNLLHSPNLWHLNRHSVSTGIAAGTWWAFIPVPGQTVFATLTALKVRGNVPLAIALTWISNPLTMIPCAYSAYRLGLLATRQKAMANEDFEKLLGNFASLNFSGAWNFVVEHIGVLWPFFVGSVLLSTLAAGVIYLLVQWSWRWNLVRRWTKRGHRVRCRGCRQFLVGGSSLTCPHCGTPVPRRHRRSRGLGDSARLEREESRAA
jgi:uncharacterized protein (DUF2062 family)